MKNFKFLLVAAVILGTGSAFTTAQGNLQKNDKGGFATYFAVYSDATHWTWTATPISGNACQPVANRYCTKVASSQPAANSAGDDLGNQYLPID